MKTWWALLCAGSVFAQTMPQDRLRTGMVEVGLRAWNVTLEGEESSHSQSLFGISASRFVTDNLSVGGLFATLSGHSPADVFCLDGMARFYFQPLQHWTPWMELRLGGLILPTGGTGATHLGAGFGWRWRPLEWMAIDLQLAGFERWGYDDPSEASNGSSDWTLQKGLLKVSLDKEEYRLWPAPSVQFLF